MNDPTIVLRKRVERYLKQNKITATAFGQAGFKNPSIVSRIRTGKITVATLNRVNAYLDKETAK